MLQAGFPFNYKIIVIKIIIKSTYCEVPKHLLGTLVSTSVLWTKVPSLPGTPHQVTWVLKNYSDDGSEAVLSEVHGHLTLCVSSTR